VIRVTLFIFLVLFIVVATGAESPDIGNLQVFPDNNPWNWDISSYAVHPNSTHFIKSIGEEVTLHPDFGTVWAGAPIGIPYVVVHSGQTQLPIVYTAYGSESDPGPFPIPLDAAIEGGPEAAGDRHVLVIDVDKAMLYELYRAFPQTASWQAASGAKFDLTSNELRPEGWTSADAAGLPIFPGLVRYEEVYIQKLIDHALRFTVEQTQKEYIYPARHFASDSTNPDLPPMGLRFRLKANYEISGFSEPVQVILLALKKYGMIIADNGSNWYISGAPDDRWDDDILGELKTISGSNFEAIVTVDNSGNPIYPPATYISARVSADLPALKVKNYPNPFNSTMILRYYLPEARRVNIKIYDISGQVVTTLFAGYQQAGDHEAKWIPQGLASGIYFYKFETDRTSTTGKILFQK
jgi:hypothetical protein